MRRPSDRGLVIGVAALGAAAVAAAVLLVPAVSGRPAGPFTLTILHNNDGESQLTGAPADPQYGGIARFVALVHDLRERAVRGPGHGVVTVSSGDNYLAGPQFAAGLEMGVPFHDSTALDRVGYDALAIGNHEFDFGPDVLAGFDPGTPFLSSNLDVAPEPRLAEPAAAGRIAPTAVVGEAGQRIGIVGATTPALRSISSPRDVVVGPDVLALADYPTDGLAGSLTAEAYPEAASGRITRVN